MPDQKTYPRFILLLAALVFLLVGIISATLSRESAYSGKDVKRFEKTLHQKERYLKEEFMELEQLFQSDSPTIVLDRLSMEYQELATTEHMYIFYYEKICPHEETCRNHNLRASPEGRFQRFH